MLVKKLKYPLPPFLDSVVTQIVYQRWLHRKAIAHIRRDRKRGNKTGTNEEYKIAIHNAVRESEGRDSYTGEILAWNKISTYNNEESLMGKREYKKTLGLLPTVDHVGDGLGPADFKICGWRTNDAKNDLSAEEFVNLCRLVVSFHDECKRPTP